jgi:hypothetical protein
MEMQGTERVCNKLLHKLIKKPGVSGIGRMAFRIRAANEAFAAVWRTRNERAKKTVILSHAETPRRGF